MNCKKCKQSYNKLQGRLPRILVACGHTLCQQCIKRNFSNKQIDYINCCQCSKPSFGNSHESFPVNATLINLLNPQSLCKIHRLKLEAYCQKDRQLLCINCIISSQHKSHKVTPINEIVEKDRNILKNCLEKIQSSKLQLKASLNDIQIKTDKLHHQYKDYVMEIQLCFKKIREDINQKQQQMLEEAKKTIQLFLKKMEEKEKQIEDKQKFIIQLENLYYQMIELPDIQYLSEENKRLFILENSKLKKIKIQSQNIQFNPNIVYSQLINLFQQKLNKNQKQSHSSPLKPVLKEKKSKTKQPAILEVNLSEQYRKHYGTSRQNSDRRSKQINLGQINLGQKNLTSQQSQLPNQNNDHLMGQISLIHQSKSINIHFTEQKMNANNKQAFHNQSDNKFNTSFSAVSSIQSFLDTSHASLLHSLKDSQAQFTLYPCQEKIYHFGGYCDNSIEHFKLQAQVSTIQQNIKIGRNKCQCVILQSYSNSKCLIVGGKSNNDGQAVDSILQYDFKNNKLEKTQFSITQKKSGFGVITKDSKLYVIGGCNQTPLSSFQQYRIGISNLNVRKLQNMSYCRDQVGCAWGLDGYIYACGGISQRNSILSTCERYNFKKHKWQQIHSMNFPRRSFALVALPNGLLAIGGHDGKNYIGSVEKYSYQTGKWSLVKDMITARCTHTAVVSKDYQNVWVCGGFKNEPLNSIEVYNVLNNEWKQIGKMNEERFLHCSILTAVI